MQNIQPEISNYWQDHKGEYILFVVFLQLSDQEIEIILHFLKANNTKYIGIQNLEEEKVRTSQTGMN